MIYPLSIIKLIKKPFSKFNDNKIAFITINMLFILLFAIIYWIWGTPEHFKSLYSAPYLTCLDALYFSFTTHCTLGFGDIVPISPNMRFITILHTITMLSYLFLASL